MRIIRRVDAFLTKQNIDRSDAKNLIFYVAALATREFSGTKHPVAVRLPSPSKLNDALLSDAFEKVWRFYSKLTQTEDGDSVARGPSLHKKINAQWDRRSSGTKKK